MCSRCSASAPEPQDAVQVAARTFGVLDIFVSSAGIFKAWPVDQFALEELARMIVINIRAVFVGIQAAVSVMRKGECVIPLVAVLPTESRIQESAPTA